MQSINRTPYPDASIAGRLEFPAHSLTLIVKGTFDLSNGGVATPAEDPLFPTGDEFHPDDVDELGSLRYASDFAYHKPRADLLLAGTCHPPRGAPARSCPVTFRVGSRAKALVVHGDRHWEGMPGFRSVSDPIPFTSVALGYERSYGGTGDERNPMGIGSEPVQTASGEEMRPLPNLEDPQDPIRSARSRPTPAGFGPLGATWSERASLLGTYKDRWLKGAWPWLPEDFDFGHYNAAPRDLQVEGYLRGDEALAFENLHPEHSEYEARLPATRVRCFLRERSPGGDAERPFYEVPMVLDTLWVDMDAEKLVLVWRGATRAESEEFEEKTELFVMEEPLEQAPASLEQCHVLFLETLAASEAAEVPEPPEPEGDRSTEADSSRDIEAVTDPEVPREELDRQVNALMARAGIDVEEIPSELRSRMKAEQDRVLGQMTDGGDALQIEAFDRQLSASLSELGVDPSALAPVSDAAKRQQLRLLEEFGVEDAASLLQDPSAVQLLGTVAAALPTLGIDPENLEPLIVEARKLQARLETQIREETGETEAMPAEEAAPETGRPWTRERVEAAISHGESLARQDLSGLDLSGLTLDRALLSDANLRGSDLSGASLRRVNAAGVDLTEARLVGTCLIEADLQQANLTDAALEGAALGDVLLARARLLRADLRSAEAAGGSFVEADLTEARLSNGRFPGADFSGAVLAGAHLEDTDLSDASIEHASSPNACFSGADLTRLRASDGSDFSGCSFARVEGPDSIWMGANLTGADFSYAQMRGANFMKAALEGANLQAADMRESRFIRARLGRARLVQMNLFEGSLEKADLTEADLSGSNLYGVEFLDAVLAGARLEGANLRMTKLG